MPMSLELAEKILDEEFPGWREKPFEEVRSELMNKLDEIFDTMNDLKAFRDHPKN